jgi:hypothetical protein
VNKQILITAGVGVVSAAIGAGAAYLITSRRLGKAFDERLEEELEVANRRYALQLMMQKEKPETPSEIVERKKLDSPLSPAGDIIRSAANVAAQAYIGDSDAVKVFQDQLRKSVKLKDTEEPSSEERNIWQEEQNKRTPVQSRRGPDGRFLPSTVISKGEPHPVTAEDFLSSDDIGYEQENLTWFAEHETLLDFEMNAVDVAIVGKDNLALFENTPADSHGEKHLYIRNDGLEKVYEVRYSEEDLADVMSLNED